MDSQDLISRAVAAMEKPEVFEDDRMIYFTHEVDSEYEAVVLEMAKAIYQHDNTATSVFPTGSEEVDAPYRCKADDALRVAIPLLRAKFSRDMAKVLLSGEASS